MSKLLYFRKHLNESIYEGSWNHFRVDYFGKYNQLENNYRESLNYAKDQIDK